MSRRVLLVRNDKTQVGPRGGNHDGDLQESLLNDDGQLDSSESTTDIDAEAAAQKRKGTLLLICCLLMVIFGVGNKVTQVVQTEYIGTYPLFLSLITTAIYIPVSFAYIIPMIKWGKAITPEQRAIPMKTWVLIGALDSLAGVIQVVTIATIKDGTLIVLLSQSAIPISMIASYFFLGSRYTPAHYIGVLIVLCGLLVVLIPRFVNPDPDAEKQDDKKKLILAIVAFICANIPMCLSTVYKEISLGAQDVDAMYLNGWVAVWQLLFSLPILIPAAWTEQIPINEIPQNLYEGFKCWLGINSYPANTSTAMAALGALYYAGQGVALTTSSLNVLRAQINTATVSDINNLPQLVNEPIAISTDDVPVTNYTTIREFKALDFNAAIPFASTLTTKELEHTIDENGEIIKTTIVGENLKRKEDNCGKAPIFTNVYMGFNLVYNILIILLIKFGSANLLFLCLTITVPVSAVIFTSKWLPKPKKFSKYDVIGLVVLLFGLVIYRFWNALFKKKKTTDEEEEGITSGNVQDASYDNTSTYQSTSSYDNNNNTNQKQLDGTVPYYGDVNVDDPFGDHDEEVDNDGYAIAQAAPSVLTNSSSNASDTTGHGRKKVKKGRK